MVISRRDFGLTSLAALGAIAAPAVLRTTAAYAQGSGPARNVILLISDGAGFHTWTAASYFRHGRLGAEVYDSFPVRSLMTTYPMTFEREPNGLTESEISYSADAAWSMARKEGVYQRAADSNAYDLLFGGYDFVRQNYTDSAAAGTALAAGVKTYNSAINWSTGDQPLRMIGDRVKSTGRALGVVSSVQVSHATPAAFMAHNPSRNNYAEIGQEIVETGLADVVMGAGHPMFDADGRYRTAADEDAFKYVGGSDTYTKLLTGQSEYDFFDSKARFEALAAGTFETGRDKLFGLAPVASTLQYQRAGRDEDRMGGMSQSVPSLELMTRGALNFLGQKNNGFFLMVEGGAIDWSCHGNHTGRMIEEQLDFNRSVEAAVAWVEANSNWDETLVIVTTDHGNGMIYGPESDQFAFQPVTNRGAGNLPDVKWHYDTHTNELVPVWAKGPGAELMVDASTGEDDNTALVGWGDVNRYHDNTDIAKVMETVMNAAG